MAARDDAVALVQRLGATDRRPSLDATTVGSIVDRHAMVDVNGIGPTGGQWVPTYNTDAAIAEVWATKAAMVAGDYNFQADDDQFSKGDVLAHMLAMEQKYAAKAVDPQGRVSGGASTLTVAGTNGPFDPVERIAERVIP